jgi:hypothetical protein
VAPPRIDPEASEVLQGRFSDQPPETCGEGRSGKGYTACHQIHAPRFLRLYHEASNGAPDLFVANSCEPSRFGCFLVLIEIRVERPNE